MERGQQIGRVAKSEPEPKGKERLSLSDLGFQDRKHNIGLTTAPTKFHTTVDPQDQARVFIAAVDYPFKGMGLVDFLAQVSPAKEGSISGILDDWYLPRSVNEGEENANLHANHMAIPGYKEFVTGHVGNWMDAMSDAKDHNFFTDRGTVQYVDTEQFILGQWEAFDREHYGYADGYLPEDLKRKKIPDWYDIDEEFERAFYGFIKRDNRKKEINDRLYLTHVIDPRTGRGFREQVGRYEPPERTQQDESPGLVIVQNSDGILAEIHLGELDKFGVYKEDAVHMTFPNTYRDGALYPVLAWKETQSGKRRFLTQEDTERLAPEDMLHPGSDVVLGRVSLAYLEDDQAKEMPKRKTFPQIPDSINQAMGAAQIPVLVSWQHYARQLLMTETVSRAEQQMHTLASQYRIVSEPRISNEMTVDSPGHEIFTHSPRKNGK